MKYYTPELEEFHIGFEYDFLEQHGSPNEKWVSKTLTEISDGEDDMYLGNTLHAIEKYERVYLRNAIRVKYLDEQDIKDLGWEVVGESKSPFTDKIYTTFKITHEIGFNTGSDYYLVLTENNRIEITVFEYSSYGGDKGNLFLTIKNKGELKKLMKQLGII